MKIMDRVRIIADNKLFRPSTEFGWLAEAIDAELAARDRMLDDKINNRVNAMAPKKWADEA